MKSAENGEASADISYHVMRLFESLRKLRNVLGKTKIFDYKIAKHLATAVIQAFCEINNQKRRGVERKRGEKDIKSKCQN